MTLSRSDLSPDQLKVYQSMLDWVRTPASNLLTVGGYAGTGKSTLLGLFAAEHIGMKIAYVSFTGRASSIVGKKLAACGVSTTNKALDETGEKVDGPWGHLFYAPGSADAKKPFCGTIHRLLYRPYINGVTEELMGWDKRMELDRGYQLIVIDEGSMVSAEVITDMLQHGVRIMLVGDHGQLPPVMGDGSLMMKPTLRLEKIHRQAEGSPIIKLSRVLREEGRLDQSLADGDKLRFGQRADMAHPRLAQLLQENRLEAAVLCWKNATRVHVNRTVREHLGFAGKTPQAGEPLIALKNHPPVFNGMRGFLTKDTDQPYDEFWLMRAHIEFPDEGLPEKQVSVCRDQFHRARPFESVDELKAAGMRAYSMSDAGRLYDFGYCMTVHKCVHPDTLVETPEGLKRAGSLPSSGTVSTPTGRATYRNFVRNKSGRMLSIMTEDGYELRVTPEHGVDVWSTDEGYARLEADKIVRGDILRLRLGYEFSTGAGVSLPEPRPQDVRAKKYDVPNEMSEDLAEFLGLMVADGTIYGRGFRLAKRHEDVSNRFSELCANLFGATPKRFFALGAHHVEVNSVLLAHWLKDVGGMNPRKKDVPDCILISPLSVQAKFLKGLFEDGTVNVKDGMLDHIEFSSAVPNMLRTVRVMLLRFGIVSGKAKSRIASIYIYGKYAKSFGEQIGFISKAKQDRLDNSRFPKGTRYIYPLRREEMKLFPARNVVQRHMAPKNTFADRAPFHHSVVARVFKMENQESVCIEVPNGHRFIQDGFCGWNSQGSQFKHAVVVADWRPDYSSDLTRRLAYTAITRASEKLSVLI